MRALYSLLFVFILSIAFSIGSVSSADVQDPLIGKDAPLISGKNSKGKGLIKLGRLMKEFGFKKDAQGNFVEVDGKYVPEIVRNVVVLNFFSTTCIPCIKEIPTYNRLAYKYKGKSVKMIYVNVEADVSNLEISRFIARNQIKVPMMLPNQREAVRKYNVYSLPRLVVINKNGKIEEVISGFKDTLEADLSNLIDRLLI